MEVGICQGCLRALPWAGATRLRPGGPFGLSLTEMSFCCPSFSLAVHPSLLQSILFSCSPSFSLAVHPIFCSYEELLHPLTLIGLLLCQGILAPPGPSHTSTDAARRDSSLLQRSASVRCGAVVIIAHAPSHRNTCETHAYRRRVAHCPPSLRLC
jgi:hypothetical protein